MSKMSKAIAALGVVAGLGVAALPLSTYAASKNAQVQVTVDGAISINLVDPSDEGKATNTTSGATFTPATGLLDFGTIKINGDPVEGVMGVQVATNNATGYTLNIKAASTTDMVGSGNAEGFVIPANASLAATTAGWAYKGGEITTLTAITTEGAQLKNTTSALTGTEVDGKKTETTDVTFSVSADGSTHDGVYVGTVVFTAAAND